MTIDKKKLVDLLVEKTSMDRQEIKKQLDQLIERILDAAKRGKALEIKEFGLFYFDEEGELKFEVSEELSTEISFKYAGMKPVEIKPERDTTISAAGEKDEEEDIFGSDVFSDIEEDDHDDEKDILEDSFVPEVPEPTEEPVENEPKSKIEDEDIKPSLRKPVRRRKDNTGLFILLIIILLAILIGAYFYYVSTQSQNSSEIIDPAPTQTESAINTEMEETPDESMLQDNMIEENGDAGEESQAVQEPQSLIQVSSEQEEANEVTEDVAMDANISASETDQPLYGLMGSVIEEANNDGYSIVVHSFTTEETAQNAARRLRTEGYRVIVNPRMVSGNTVWRVSVGQFETLEEAQQATERLPNPYNTQNFIQRIQLN